MTPVKQHLQKSPQQKETIDVQSKLIDSINTLSTAITKMSKSFKQNSIPENDQGNSKNSVLLKEQSDNLKSINKSVKATASKDDSRLVGIMQTTAKYLSPGTLAKGIGLASGSPLMMLVGDKFNQIIANTYENLKESKEQKRLLKEQAKQDIFASQNAKDERAERGTMVDYLKKQYDILRGMDEESRKNAKKTSGLLALLLGAALFAAGVGIGGIARAIILPFEMMVRAVGAITKMISSILRLDGFFGLIGRFFAQIVRPFQAIMGSGIILKITKNVTDSLGAFTNIFGRFAAGLRFGFRILGWPITLIMGVIDFVKAFMETEGTLWEKTKAGFAAAIMGFFEFPLKFVAWLVDKVAGFMGVEMEGDTFEKIKEGFWNLITLPLTVFERIYNYLKEAFSGGLFSGINKIFSDLRGLIRDWIISAIGWVPGSAKLIKRIFPDADVDDSGGGLENIGSVQDVTNAAMNMATDALDSGKEMMDTAKKWFSGFGRGGNEAQQATQGGNNTTVINNRNNVAVPDTNTRNDDNALNRSRYVYAE